MANLVISGDSSGSVTLSAPAVSGTTVLTLPTTSGTLVTTGGGSTGSFTTLTSSGDSSFATSSGNVGIGTGSPAAKLEVVSSTGAQFIGTFRTGDATAANNSGGGFYGISSATAGSRNAYMWLDADGANFTGSDYFYISKIGNSGVVDIIQQSAAAMTFQTSATERMRITSAGDVGIGTTSPALSKTPQLFVRGNSDTSNDYIATFEANNATAAIGISFQTISSYDNANTAPLIFDTNGTERMRISANGNVGIGTNGPGANLEVFSSSDVITRIHKSGVAQWNIGVDSNPYAYVDSTVMAFGTGSAESMRISSGNLLVGTTSGSSKLFVSDANNRDFATAQFKIGGNGYGVGLFMDGTAAYLGQDSNIREFRMWSGSNAAVGVQLSAGANSWASYSDESLKDIISPITDAVSKLSELRTVIGKYKTDAEDARRSFLIAQDVKAVFPEAVSQDAEGMLSLRYTDMIPVLVKAIQEQQDIITQLQLDVAALKGAA